MHGNEFVTLCYSTWTCYCNIIFMAKQKLHHVMDIIDAASY